MDILNLSAYQFVRLPAESLPDLRVALRERARYLGLKGTILISPEGINLFLAAEESAIRDYQQFLRGYDAFSDLWFRRNRCFNVFVTSI